MGLLLPSVDGLGTTSTAKDETFLSELEPFQNSG